MTVFIKIYLHKGGHHPMEIPISRSTTRSMALFWSLMAICGILTVACVRLALNELGQPWGGFAFNMFGQVMKANATGLVFFDTILAVDNRQVEWHSRRGADIREVIRRTPEGTPLTYLVRRGPTKYEVTVPVQHTTWRRLAVEFVLPLFVALAQLCMGAIVFLLRPHSKRNWVFLAFCLFWFGLFVTVYDFQSTHVFSQFFLFCWYMTSAVLLHLAFVFPEERQVVRQHPRVQYLFYLPSLGLWGGDRLTDHFFPNDYFLYHIGMQITQVHVVYWGAA